MFNSIIHLQDKRRIRSITPVSRRRYLGLLLLKF